MQTLSKKAERDYIKFAKELRRDIGAHNKLIGTGCDNDTFIEARKRSDAAVSLLKYIIQSVDNRHIAVIIATYSGCPGYINYR